MKGMKQKLERIISQFFLALIIIGIILGITLALTNLSIEPDLPVERVVPYPYATKYAIEIVPDETIHIGSISLQVSPVENNSVSVTTNDDVSIMGIGDTKEISERHAQISVFGVSLFETNYRVQMLYKGSIQHPHDPAREMEAFDASIETSKQIPEFILSRVIPVSISINSIASDS